MSCKVIDSIDRPSRLAVGLSAALSAALALVPLEGCGMRKPDSPLTIAVERGDAASIRELLARGADPDAADAFGLTPLCRAARLGRLEVVSALLEAGARVDLPDHIPTREGWTPLMNAVHKNRGAIARALIAAGADVNLRTAGGMTALSLASADADPTIVEALLEAGADPRDGPGGSAALTNAVAAGRIETVRALLAKDPGLRVRDGLGGRAALWIARIRGRSDILALLAGGRKPGGAVSGQGADVDR